MMNIAQGVAARISRRLTGAPTRVALAATGIVALVYLAISGALVGVVSHNLTASTDKRLATALAHLQHGQLVPQGTGGISPYQDPEDRHFGTPTLEWVIADGALYAPPGQGAVLPVDDEHVSVSVTSNGSRVRLTVEDDGPGIPLDERETIFDRFHRASATAGGAGLGLAIGDAVVRATGGRWVIAESPAGGASMSVLWPRGADH